MPISRLMLATSAVVLLAAAPVAAQTLYLGDQEVDTSESATMSAAVARCAELALAAPGADVAAAFTRPSAQPSGGPDDGDAPDALPSNGETATAERAPPAADEITTDEARAVDPGDDAASTTSIPLEALSLAPDDAADDEGGDSGAAAGEGSGQGPDQGSESEESDPGSTDSLDLDAVTLQACKEAGLVF